MPAHCAAASPAPKPFYGRSCVTEWAECNSADSIRSAPFIADFACIRARLVVEIDGATHGSDSERRYDARREAFLRSRSWEIVRITNDDVYSSLGTVLELIYRRSRTAPEAPSTASRSPSPAFGG